LKEFGEPGNAEDQATWEAALQELERGKFVEWYKATTFKVTRAGYKLAKKLREGD